MTDRELDMMIAKLNVTIEEQYRERKSVYTVEDIQGILGLSRSAAYRLAATAPFRVIRINRKIRVPKKSFDVWLEGVM